jgi:transposase
MPGDTSFTDVSNKLQSTYDAVEDCSDDDATLGTYKLKFRPTRHQQHTLRRILASSNMAWNWTKWLIEEKGFSKKDLSGLQKIVARKETTTDFTPKEVVDNADLLKSTSTVRLTAMRSYLSALRASTTLHKGHTDRFDVDNKELYPRSGAFTVQKQYINKFRPTMVSKKCLGKLHSDFGETRLSVLPNAFSIGRGVPHERFLKISKLRSAKKMPPVEHDSVVQLRKDGKWLLNIPCDRKYLRRDASGDPAEKNKAVSLDPVVRVFQTVYYPINRTVTDVGTSQEADRINFHKTKAQRHEVLAKSTTKRPHVAEQHERAAAKRWTKHKIARDHVHRTLADSLVRDNQLVVIGDFSSSRCASRRAGSKLTRATRSKLYSWAHYAFKQKLVDRARGTPCRVILQDESWTSKTCGRCGNIKPDLGGTKTYECKLCGLTVDRDVNGARNILIKSMT